MSKILIFGASLTYGVADPQGGWVTRLRKYIDENYNTANPEKIQVFNLSVSAEPVTRLRKFAENEILRRIKNDQDNLIIYSISTNDCNPANSATQRLTDPKEFKRSISELIKTGKKHSTKTIIMEIPPVNEANLIDKFQGQLTNERVSEYNHYIREVCHRTQTTILNTFDQFARSSYLETLNDGIHPNSQGHQLYFEVVKNFLEQQGLINPDQ